MRALARLVHGWPPAVAHPRLRQRGRVRRRHSDLRAWPARARLSHHSLRQDALLRSRSAAWLRAAADDRHLSRRFQLDAGLGSPGASSELVSQHELGPGRGTMRALEPARLRRRSRLHGGARDLRHRAVARSAAVPHGRLVLPSARPVRRASALLGPLSRRGHRHAGAGRRARSAFAPPAPRLRDGRGAGDGSASARRASRLLRRDRLYRRPHRPAHGRRCARRRWRRTRSSSSPAITARCWASTASGTR